MSTFDAISKSTPLAQTKVSVPVTAPATTQAQWPKIGVVYV